MRKINVIKGEILELDAKQRRRAEEIKIKHDGIYRDNYLEHEKMWSKYINISSLSNKFSELKNAFAGVMTTNGIDVSVIFDCRKSSLTEYSFDINTQSKQHVTKKFTKMTGIDSGLKYAMGWVIRRDSSKFKPYIRDEPIQDCTIWNFKRSMDRN